MSLTARKLIGLICILGLLGALAATPALAGKKKKGSFTAENPVPHPAGDGCNEGTEGVSKTSEAIKAPFNGLLTATMENFQGDWDLFVTDADGGALVSSVESQLTGAAATEEVSILLKKGYEFAIVPCNWVGGPSADVAWTFTATK
jgi:hypothetical protein